MKYHGYSCISPKELCFVHYFFVLSVPQNILDMDTGQQDPCDMAAMDKLTGIL